MRPLSLRNRLVVGVVGLLAVGLLVSNVGGVLLFKSFQLQQVDDQLRAPFGAAPPQVQDWTAQVVQELVPGRAADQGRQSYPRG